MSPVANPGKIIGAPVNYEAHVEESKQNAGISHGRVITSIGDWGLFLKASSSLIGFGSEIVLRFEGRRNDHELKLGVVIGSVCSQIKAQYAMQYIAGYTMALDMTLRGKEFQCFRKSIDTYSVLGPWLVTPDEITDPNRLDLWTKVNGQIRQQSNTRHLVYDIARLIEFASSMYTLQPGDVIMTGTPADVGPVGPGDILLAGIEGIGEFPIRIIQLTFESSDRFNSIASSTLRAVATSAALSPFTLIWLVSTAIGTKRFSKSRPASVKCT